MPGGKGKIQEYNESLTPEQRKASARRAAQAPRKSKTIRQLAKIINNAPAVDAARDKLKALGINDEDMTNAAVIAAVVFRAAFEGDLRAVEKWERYIGQADKTRDDAEIKLIEAKTEELKSGGGSSGGSPVQIVIAPRRDNEAD